MGLRVDQQILRLYVAVNCVVTVTEVYTLYHLINELSESFRLGMC